MLGEKRFVAVVQVDGRRFLIGGGQASVEVLTELKAGKTFKKTLKKADKALSGRQASVAGKSTGRSVAKGKRASA